MKKAACRIQAGLVPVFLGQASKWRKKKRRVSGALSHAMPQSAQRLALSLATPSATFTVSATFSGVKPKCLNSTGAGADSP